jgi:glutamate--cysteine ligase
MQAIAGVHFNYSLRRRVSGPRTKRTWAAPSRLREFRSAELMGSCATTALRMARDVFATARRRRSARSFRPDGHELLVELDSATWYAPYATSLRMSDLGTEHEQGRLIRANSLAEYLAGYRSAVTTEERAMRPSAVVDGDYRQLNANILQIENEYYSTDSPKPSKATKSRPLVALAEGGIDYVEVRTLDLSAADPVGMNQESFASSRRC